MCSDLSWRQYLQSIFKQVSQRVGCFYHASRFLHPQTILYLYKSTVRPIMEYCCHLWAGAPRTHLSPLDRVERRVKNLVGQVFSEELQPLSVRRDVASLSLFYRYYFGRCSPVLSDCVPQLRSFLDSLEQPRHRRCSKSRVSVVVLLAVLGASLSARLRCGIGCHSLSFLRSMTSVASRGA